METDQQMESINPTSSQEMLAIEGANTENLPKLPSATQPASQWEQTSKQISQSLEQLPEYLNSFFKTYRTPI
ncbi:MAG: hypothetical protein KME21_22680 [Desmonostoc vinosum HA7617-LM4]|jgi:hypothetical protein|nr:hypothetical protein [Desmonostoc vinosum HA7617-LM4]